MDKNQKKNIAIVGASGVAAGVIGGEAARQVEERIHKTEEHVEEEQQHVNNTNENHQTPPSQTNSSNQQTSASNQQDPDYSGITEVVPVDTGGTNETEVAEVVIDVPQEELLAGVDNVNPDEVAETILMEPELIIEDGLDLASTHAQEPETIEEEVFNLDEDPDLEDEEDLADLEEEEDDGEIIDDLV